MLTATAERPPHLRRATWISAAVLLAIAASVFVLSYRSHESTEPVAARHPVALSSSARHRFTSVGQLVDASDLVVEGHVVATEGGRLFGAGTSGGGGREEAGAIRSQITTVHVDSVLGTTDATSDTTVLVEEEAELADGTPVRVDGMRPGEVGDRGVWFLVASRDPDFPGYVVANAQGRYLRGPGGSLRGGDRTDALVRAVERSGSADLTAAIARAS